MFVLRAYSDEFINLETGDMYDQKCPICGTNRVIKGKNFFSNDIFNCYVVNEQGEECAFDGLTSRFSKNSFYAVCKKCNHKTTIYKPLESEVEIIKNDKLKSYSVADELLKWAKLKEDGHISEQEFDDAKKKLLKRD